MDILGYILRKITYPLWMIKDGHRGILKYQNYYNYLDNYTREDLRSSQIINLNLLLKHAYENTSYYRNLFDTYDFIPEVNVIDDLNVLPLLTKDIIRNNHEHIISSNIDPADRFPAATGGSTGKPMHFFRDRECLYKRKGQDLYLDRFIGYKNCEKIAYFVAFSHYDSHSQKLKAAIRNATCDRMLRFNPYEINDDYLWNFAEQYKKYKPKIIKCFPNSLGIFASFVDKNSIKLPPVDAISCTGENLYLKQRDLFEKVFGGKVFERYGSKECGIDASECSAHDGMHMFTEGVIIELLGESDQSVRAGEIGRIVITDLFNYGFPLIRYEIGDMAVAYDKEGLCSCGNPLPKLKKVLGRDRDILFDENDNPKPGYIFVEAINNMNLDAQFQVIQNKDKDVLIKIVDTNVPAEDIRNLIKKFKKILGDGILIETEFVDSIDRDPSGKYRYIMSYRKLW